MAFAAAFDALVHASDLFATVGTGLADFCAGCAVVRVVVAVAAHETDAGVAGCDAVEHQFDVRLSDVIAAFGQARGRQHVTEHGLALLAVFGCSLVWMRWRLPWLFLRFVD